MHGLSCLISWDTLKSRTIAGLLMPNQDKGEVSRSPDSKERKENVEGYLLSSSLRLAMTRLSFASSSD